MLCFELARSLRRCYLGHAPLMGWELTLAARLEVEAEVAVVVVLPVLRRVVPVVVVEVMGVTVVHLVGLRMGWKA